MKKPKKQHKRERRNPPTKPQPRLRPEGVPAGAVVAESDADDPCPPWVMIKGNRIVCRFKDGRLMEIPLSEVAALERTIGHRSGPSGYHVVNAESRSLLAFQTKDRPWEHGFRIGELTHLFLAHGIPVRSLDLNGRPLSGDDFDPSRPWARTPWGNSPGLAPRYLMSFWMKSTMAGLGLLLASLPFLFVVPRVAFVAMVAGFVVTFGSLAVDSVKYYRSEHPQDGDQPRTG
jgi:hypothetical protein